MDSLLRRRLILSAAAIATLMLADETGAQTLALTGTPPPTLDIR
jgi:hypothetical protein